MKKGKYPKWVLKRQRKGAAIHKIGNNYYLYEVASKWDPSLKRAKKITKSYLGVITEEGLREPEYRRNKPTTIKEYGVSWLLIEENQEVLKGLKRHFPSWWKEIFVLSCLRLMHRCPLKNMPIYYQDSWLSEEIKDVRLHEKAIHNLLEDVGRDREAIVEFLRDFISCKEGILIDLTHVFSLSENMLLASKGYNSEFNFTPQVNLLFMFSISKRFPLFYRVLPGNVRDVKSLKSTIEESRIKDAIIIGDKGFYSKENIDLLGQERLRYVLPLKRDNPLIDYAILEKGRKEDFEGYFSFKKRYIWYYKCGEGDLAIWVFVDERLKVEEQEDYLNRIETYPEFGYTIEGFHERQRTFGTIALITNLKELSAKEVFQYFKSRSEIETMFDVFKNILQADRTYMRTDRSMESWMLINYLALTYYYKIYHLLIKHGILNKYSVFDVVMHLSRFRKVRVSAHWIDLEIPKQSRKLIEKIKLPIT